MKPQHCLTILFYLWCFNTHADQAINSTGDYSVDLAQVAGAIRLISTYKKICDNAFPSFKTQNAKAYQNWRKQYLPFLQEIEGYERAFLAQDGDYAKSVQKMIEWEKIQDINKEALRKHLSNMGAEKFREVCHQYPIYLFKMDNGNLEYFYAEQVTTIRKGAKPN
jgi:hypothetical protein